MDLIIAGGYPYRFKDVQAELAAARAGKWFPATVDFNATALRSGTLIGKPATFDALLDLIAKRDKHSIKELGLIGHGNDVTFSVAGEFDANINDLVFRDAGMIHPDSIKKNIKKIVSIRDRFYREVMPWEWGTLGLGRRPRSWSPTITIYACHAGAGEDLLGAISEAFQCIVLGFKNEVNWCFTASGAKVERGRTFYDSVGAGIIPDCSKFNPDIRVWRPENKKGSPDMGDPWKEGDVRVPGARDWTPPYGNR